MATWLGIIMYAFYPSTILPLACLTSLVVRRVSLSSMVVEPYVLPFKHPCNISLKSNKGTIWVYIATWLCSITVIASLAEMASMAPSSGGQYHWVSEVYFSLALQSQVNPANLSNSLHRLHHNEFSVMFRVGYLPWAGKPLLPLGLTKVAR